MYYKNVNLKSLELFEETIDGNVRHLLKAVYEYKNEIGKYEIIFPRIDLGIPNNHIPDTEQEIGTLYGGLSRLNMQINIRGNHFNLLPDEKSHTYYVKTIEEYPKKMTLDEIEKKLGHKIELVSKK